MIFENFYSVVKTKRIYVKEIYNLKQKYGLYKPYKNK